MLLYDVQLFHIIDHPHNILLQEDIQYDVNLYLDLKQQQYMEQYVIFHLIFAKNFNSKNLIYTKIKNIQERKFPEQ